MEECEIWQRNPDFQHEHFILFHSHQSVVIMFWLVSLCCCSKVLQFSAESEWNHVFITGRRKTSSYTLRSVVGAFVDRKKEQIYTEKPGNFEISLRKFLPKHPENIWDQTGKFLNQNKPIYRIFTRRFLTFRNDLSFKNWKFLSFKTQKFLYFFSQKFLRLI